MDKKSATLKNHLVTFGDLEPGDEFRIPLQEGTYMKINYHEYDLGYYQINALNLDTKDLDFFKDDRVVRTSVVRYEH